MRWAAARSVVPRRPRGPRLALAGFAVGIAVTLALAGCGGRHARYPATAGAVRETRTVARTSPCSTRPLSKLSYAWPLQPTGREHPIRGTFGEPRMIITALTTGRPSGTAQFHQGVDVSGRVRQRVFAVTDGYVRRVTFDRVDVVDAPNNRMFQYYHVIPAVRVGDHVVAGATVIGRIKREARHVHITEIQSGRPFNPLLHLTPYVDRTPPRVRELLLTTPAGTPVAPAELRGKVVLAVRAEDAQTGDVRGAWHGMPVAPAFVAWSLTRPDGAVVRPLQVVADFRRRIPRPARFWKVYADSTRQNFPVIDGEFHYEQPGRFDYLLANPLDTRALPDGDYLVHVVARDECLNAAELVERVTVRNAAAPPGRGPASG